MSDKEVSYLLENYSDYDDDIHRLYELYYNLDEFYDFYEDYKNKNDFNTEKKYVFSELDKFKIHYNKDDFNIDLICGLFKFMEEYLLNVWVYKYPNIRKELSSI